MLPGLEKIMEKVVYDQLLDFIQEHNILNDYQSGFRKGFNCETAIQYALTDWKEAINSGLKVGILCFLI